MPSLGPLIIISQLAIACIPGAVRLCYGWHPLGDSWQSRLCTVFMFLCMAVNGTIASLLLGASGFDFYRRLESAEMLTKLTNFPGIREEEFFLNAGAGERRRGQENAEKEENLIMAGDTLLLARIEEERHEAGKGGGEGGGGGGGKRVGEER